jgi:hypothetical protein
VTITFSAGVSQHETRYEKVFDVLEEADKALYAAKELGRNRVLRYGESGSARITDPTEPVDIEFLRLLASRR